MSKHQRNVRNLSELETSKFDLLVVGGGIVGAGVARDAALRGLRIALIDQNDFAFGTSSRSSRLLHGGLRYLAQGRIQLVREANREKNILHRIAPHLAQPLPFVFPTYRGTPWKKWKLRLGVWLYDLLAGGRRLGRSRALGRTATIETLPGINSDRLTGAVEYFDGFTNDSRLVIDTIRSAHQAAAVVGNYIRYVDSTKQKDHWVCELTDTQTGQNLQLRTRAIVNATGPWSDLIPHSSTQLRLTKGVHLIVPRERLPVHQAVVMTEGKRILFIIPWQERLILGTTDTDYQGPVETPDCSREDVDYIFSITNRFFPKLELQYSDLISTWSGIRPLVFDSKGGPSDTSRTHRITSPHSGWWDIAGGKLTTYRLMAEQTVDQVVGFLGQSVRPCETADQPLLPATETGFSSLFPPEVNRDAIQHFCDQEWTMELSDLMIRRTSWSYYHKDHLQIAAKVAPWMAEICNWNPDDIEKQIANYTSTMSRSEPWRVQTESRS